ncbi:hypothetical protein TNCV_5111581 [Trichonephila clavipes]|nr:hypothetical protein TNCV_5111581 [Trichonephila clavipes]
MGNVSKPEILNKDNIESGDYMEWKGPLIPAKEDGKSPPPWNVECEVSPFGLWVRRSEVMSECLLTVY